MPQHWGIDTFVGELNGEIFVWQSKFFLTWDDAGPQSQVRASFDQVMAKAADKGYVAKAWTLCVPCNLSPDQHLWFTNWAKRKKSKVGVEVRLLNGTDLRYKLLQEDARDVRREYFPQTVSDREPDSVDAVPEPIARAADPSEFDNALFVKQLHAAGHVETDAMRGLFFATEALFRDYTAKGDQRALDALEELHLDIQEVWEFAFNEHHSDADPAGKIQGLVEAVMERAAARPDPAHLALRPAHKKGAAHRLVEAANAGWVKHWRDIAAAHKLSGSQEAAGSDAEDSLVSVGAGDAEALPSRADQEGSNGDE